MKMIESRFGHEMRSLINWAKVKSINCDWKIVVIVFFFCKLVVLYQKWFVFKKINDVLTNLVSSIAWFDLMQNFKADHFSLYLFFWSIMISDLINILIVMLTKKAINLNKRNARKNESNIFHKLKSYGFVYFYDCIWWPIMKWIV